MPLTILEKFDDIGIHVREEDCYFPLEIVLTLKLIFQREIFLREQICGSGMQKHVS